MAKTSYEARSAETSTETARETRKECGSCGGQVRQMFDQDAQQISYLISEMRVRSP